MLLPINQQIFVIVKQIMFEWVQYPINNQQVYSHNILRKAVEWWIEFRLWLIQMTYQYSNHVPDYSIGQQEIDVSLVGRLFLSRFTIWYVKLKLTNKNKRYEINLITTQFITIHNVQYSTYFQIN